MDRESDLETWLRNEVAKSYDEYARDPSIGIAAEDMMARIRASYRGAHRQASGGE